LGCYEAGDGKPKARDGALKGENVGFRKVLNVRAKRTSALHFYFVRPEALSQALQVEIIGFGPRQMKPPLIIQADQNKTSAHRVPHQDQEQNVSFLKSPDNRPFGTSIQ